LQELVRLVHEEYVFDTAVDRSGSIELTRSGWADDGDFRQAFDEVGWFRHDQICLERLWLADSQIDKRQDSARLIVGQRTALPALSRQTWKCMTSAPPMLMRRTSGRLVANPRVW